MRVQRVQPFLEERKRDEKEECRQKPSEILISAVRKSSSS